MVFGEPSDTGTWGWRYEGHHISHSWTVINGTLSSTTPQFFGTNPAYVRQGSSTGERVLNAEDYLARTLLGSLSAEQVADAIIADEAPDDILTTSDREAAMQDDVGVAYSALSGDQQATLWALIEEYARGAGRPPSPRSACRRYAPPASTTSSSPGWEASWKASRTTTACRDRRS